MAKEVADVALRVWTPQHATVRFVKQVAPAVGDLTGRCAQMAPQAVDYPTGAWGQVSGRGDSHPPALAEPGVRVSPHRAPTGRPGVRAIRCQWTKRLGWR